MKICRYKLNSDPGAQAKAQAARDEQSARLTTSAARAEHNQVTTLIGKEFQCQTWWH